LVSADFLSHAVMAVLSRLLSPGSWRELFFQQGRPLGGPGEELPGSEGCQDNDAKDRASRSDPSVAEAFALFHAEDTSRRWRLEAYLLTHEPLEQIASHCSFSMDLLEAYAQIFFDVRPYFASTDWILVQVIGTSWLQGFAGQSLGSLWKFFAYTSGARALEAIIALTTNTPFPAWLEDVLAKRPAYYKRRLRLLGKVMLAAMTANSPVECKTLVDAREQLRRLDSKALGTKEKPNSLFSIMLSLLNLPTKKKNPRRKSAAGNINGMEGIYDLNTASNAIPPVSVGSFLIS
jgi:hypothetical protein